MASFTPSPAELALVTQIFLKADPQKVGILTGDAALKVFSGARLQTTVLGEIWSIADEDNNGWLPKKGVAIAVRLMGWAQKGEKVTQALVNKRESVFLALCISLSQILALSSWSSTYYRGYTITYHTTEHRHLSAQISTPRATYTNSSRQDQIHAHISKLPTYEWPSDWSVLLSFFWRDASRA